VPIKPRYDPQVTSPATMIERGVDQWAPVLAFAALPTVGLLAGPSYSSMIIGLAVAQLVFGVAAGRGVPSVDRSFATLAGLFLALCWVSVAWSIVPRESIRGALGLTGVLVAMLVVQAGRYDRPEAAAMLFRVLYIAMLVGIAVACVDMALHYPLESLVSTKPGVHAATKYNRGFDYLVLIAWPVMARLWERRRWWDVGALVVAIGVMLTVTLSEAARAAVATGVIVLVLAWAAPRLVAGGFTWVVAALVAVLPVALNLLAARRAELARFLKPSGMSRLEIWDYMTARVFEHPIRGWGLLSAKHLPIHADELARYTYIDARGIYPHNQWLELWVELGALGAALGLAFALLVLWRVRRLPRPVQPFAYAAFTSAMTVASVNYEVTTDSWWSALAATAVLFGILGRHAGDTGRSGRVG
jgi:O-Antigen ligase